MADQLDLAIVLKAILDAKGFEQAQAAIKGLAGAANNSGPPVEGLGKKASGLTKELGGSRGAVADLTRVLLQNIGVTGPAGEVAKALGTSMSFLGGTASIAAAAATAFVGAAALLMPKLIEWIRHSGDLTEEQQKIRQAIVDDLPRLEELAEATGHVSEALERQLAATQRLAREAQQKKIEETEKEIKAIRQQLPAEDMIAQKRVTHAEVLRDLTRLEKEQTEQLTEEQKRQRTLRLELDEKRALLARLREAEDAGLTLGQLNERQTKDQAEADRKAKKATEERARAQRDLNAAFEEGRRGQLESKMRDIQGALAKDSDALAKKEKKQKDGELSDELKRLLVLGNAEQQLAAERDQLAREEAQRDRQLAAEKRALDASMIAGATNALAAFFGNNKTARIAGAIADAYAGATRAFVDYPWPYSAVVAGIVLTQGLANVANIKKQEIGFDDPFNDLLAEKMGRKSAKDFIHYYGLGFEGGLTGRGGGGTTNVYNQSTTINRGMSVGNLTMPGYLGAGRTQFWKNARRELSRIGDRLEKRTTIGR